MDAFTLGLNVSGGRFDCEPLFTLNITPDDVDVFTYNDGQIFVITILLPILLMLGFVGNTAFIFVVYRRLEMRTGTNWYLTNLAVADIVFLFSAITDKIWAYSNSSIPGDNGPHGHVGCVVLCLLGDWTYFASLGFVTLVSFDRFLAVRRPQASKIRRGKKAIPTRLCTGSWILGFCFAASLIPSRSKFVRYCLKWPKGNDKYEDWPLYMHVCRSREVWIDALSSVIQTVPFFLAFVLNLFLYVSIVRGLDRSITNLGSHGMSQDKNVTMRNQIALMLIVNGVVFFCCLFPFELMCVFQLIRNFQEADIMEWHDLLFEISRALSYINSVANPLIYTLMSHRYRANFKTAFSFQGCGDSVARRGRKENNAAPIDEFRNTSQRAPAPTATRVEIL